MDVSDAAKGGGRRYQPPEVIKLAFYGFLVMWLFVPVLLRNNLAQDAVPFVVAGELARRQPDDIYAPKAVDLYDLPPAFAARSCEISPPDTDCASTSVAYVSPPPALLFSYPLALLGPSRAVFAFRMVGAAALAAGMLSLWRRLASRTPKAGMIMLIATVALTPFVMNAVVLGQTAPLLFLSAAVGVGARDASRLMVVGIAALFVTTIAFKLFPVALVVVIVWQRRWRLIGAAAALVAALMALTLAVVPIRLFGQFAESTRTFNAFADANPHNSSLVALVRPVAESFALSSAGSKAMLFARLLIVAAGWWFIIRPARDDDAQWAWSWLFLLFFVPTVWWHYLWVAIAACGVGLAARTDLDDRKLWVFALVSMATIAPSIAATSGQGLPLVQASFLVVVAAAGSWLVPRAPRALGRAQF
ncbi:MAG: DUF2029 domain-containing protein [Actinobacteria bacterium]|nr:DUF2029 domain-containing protein [Actinomycetota bacterium]